MINGFSQFDPNQYAKIYAQQNNITTSQAKEELRTKFGEPKQAQGNSYSNLDIFEKMELLNQIEANNKQKDIQNGEKQPFDLMAFVKNFFSPYQNSTTSNNTAPQGPRQEGDYNPTRETKESRLNISEYNFIDNNTFSTLQKNPDEYAKEFMENYNEQNPQNTITLDEAKEMLEEKYGKPQRK